MPSVFKCFFILFFAFRYCGNVSADSTVADLNLSFLLCFWFFGFLVVVNQKQRMDRKEVEEKLNHKLNEINKQTEEDAIKIKEQKQFLEIVKRYEIEHNTFRKRLYKTCRNKWAEREQEWWKWENIQDLVDWFIFQIDYNLWENKCKININKENIVQCNKETIVQKLERDKFNVNCLDEVSSVGHLNHILFGNLFGNSWDWSDQVSQTLKILYNSICALRERFPLPKIKQEEKQDGDNFDKYLLCPLSNQKMNEPVESPFDGKIYDKQSIVKYWKDQKCKIPDYEPNDDDDFENGFCDDKEVRLATEMLMPPFSPPRKRFKQNK